MAFKKFLSTLMEYYSMFKISESAHGKLAEIMKEPEAQGKVFRLNFLGFG